MSLLKVTGRLGRFSAFLCIQRTWSWKVLSVGATQSAQGSSSLRGHLVDAVMQAHTAQGPGPSVISLGVATAHLLEPVLVTVLLPWSLYSAPWVYLTNSLVLAPRDMQLWWSAFNTAHQLPWAPAQYYHRGKTVTETGRRDTAPFMLDAVSKELHRNIH